MIKLIAQLGGEQVNIVPHFIDHYKFIGVEEFLIILHEPKKKADLNRQYKHWLDYFGIKPILTTEHFSRSTKSALFKEVQDSLSNDDWVVRADQDEFHDYKELKNIKGAIDYCDRLGYDMITGYWYERFDKLGSLKQISTTSNIFSQFPFASKNALRKVAGIRCAPPYKVALSRGNIRTDGGFHIASMGINKSNWPLKQSGKKREDKSFHANIAHFVWDETIFSRKYFHKKKKSAVEKTLKNNRFPIKELELLPMISSEKIFKDRYPRFGSYNE